jgi:hypothetical protein
MDLFTAIDHTVFDIMPEKKDLDLAFNSLPPNSSLCVLFTDILVQEVKSISTTEGEEEFLDYMSSVPAENVCRILHAHLLGKPPKRDYRKERCKYHDHPDENRCGTQPEAVQWTNIEMEDCVTLVYSKGMIEFGNRSALDDDTDDDGQILLAYAFGGSYRSEIDSAT